jgi:cytochrome c-type biogenesis protein CcmH
MVGMRWAVAAAMLGAALAADARAPLSAEQETRARRIDGLLIAPCCFANTVAEHHSPLADEVRAEIRLRIAAGASEAEILEAFAATYGERILAAPRLQGFNWLAYALPFVALGGGLLAVVLTLRRHRPARAAVEAVPAAAPNPRQARLEAELARYES